MADAASITIRIDSRPAIAGAREITVALESLGLAGSARGRGRAPRR